MEATHIMSDPRSGKLGMLNKDGNDDDDDNNDNLQRKQASCSLATFWFSKSHSHTEEQVLRGCLPPDIL